MEKIMLRALGSRLLQAPVSVLRSVGGFGSYLGLLAKSRNSHIAIGLFGLFALAAHFVPFDRLYITENFIIVCIEVLLSLTYLPAAMIAMITRPMTARDQLVLGIWVAWSFDLLTRVYALTQRYTPHSDWMLTSSVLTFLLFGRMLAAMLHITAPDALEGETRRAAYLKVAVAFVIGMIVGTLLIYLTYGQAIDTVNPP